jgi:hypothetical protein
LVRLPDRKNPERHQDRGGGQAPADQLLEAVTEVGLVDLQQAD